MLFTVVFIVSSSVQSIPNAVRAKGQTRPLIAFIAFLTTYCRYRSETWPVRKENVVALKRAEMRMVRWMCGVKLKDRLPSKELRERLGVDDIALVLRKDDDDWVKKCMEHEVEGSRPRGRPKKTWKEVVREDCQARKLNKEDAMDLCKWRKVRKEAR